MQVIGFTVMSSHGWHPHCGYSNRQKRLQVKVDDFFVVILNRLTKFGQNNEYSVHPPSMAALQAI
jgi:hypothetical protein